MNYGNDNLEKRKKHVASKKNMKKKRVGVRFFKALIICLILVMVIGAGSVAYCAKRIIDNTPTVTPADVKPSGMTTFVMSKDGTILEKFYKSGSNRVYKSIDEIPEYLANAFIAIEDERFHEHNGIDLQGILRAFVKGVTSGGFSEGASTITQQLIKNNVFPNFVEEKDFYDKVERKLQEQYIALQIEKQMTKDEILEAYMNTINLGQGCLGVQTAAKRYFNKDVSQLTLSECAVIAGITQNPTANDPVVYPETNARRRKLVLGNMLKQEMIAQEEYDEAMADPVYDRIVASPPVEDTEPYSYFNDEVYAQVIEDLQVRKGFTEAQAYNAVISGGLTIVSTQDMWIQQICDEEVANESSYPFGTEYGLEYALTVTRTDGTVENYSKEMLAEFLRTTYGKEYPLVFSSQEDAYNALTAFKTAIGYVDGDMFNERIDITPQPQVSVVVMDQYTGEVKAMVGGRGEKTSSLALNRATDSTRQPGSCFKILSAYAPAIDAYGYTLATAIPDEGPFKYEGKNQYANNWDGVYLGSARVRYAIEHSMNVCALNTITDIGPENAYEYLLNFGFTTLVNNDNEDYPGFSDAQQPTALGGITRGVYNLEMTAAYAAIANGGTYIKPILYTKVLDHDGNVLLDNSVPDSHSVIKDTTAALLTSAMQDVMTIGTGGDAHLDRMPAAGKTGTTEQSTDLWLSAYTPYYTASVWGGYDCNKPMNNISQNWHKTIWRNIMNRIHESYPYKDFTMPSTIQRKTICTETGLLATEGCPSLTEYFAPGTIPTRACAGHKVEEKEEDKEKEDGENGDNTGGEGTGGEGNGGEGTGGEGTGGEGTGGEGTGGEGNGETPPPSPETPTTDPSVPAA